MNNLSTTDAPIEFLDNYYSIQTLDDTLYNEKLSWCFENSQGRFRDQRRFESRIWYFEKELDATMFVIKWI